MNIDDLVRIQKTFNENYTQANLRQLNIKDQRFLLPPAVRKHFNDYGKNLDACSYSHCENMDKIFSIAYQDSSDMSYIILKNIEDVNLFLHMVDMDVSSDNTIISEAEVTLYRSDTDSILDNKPYLNYSLIFFSNSDYDAKILRIRQAAALNALSQALFGLPIYSNLVLDDQERELWRNLEKSKIAKKISQKNSSGENVARFVFDKYDSLRLFMPEQHAGKNYILVNPYYLNENCSLERNARKFN